MIFGNKGLSETMLNYIRDSGWAVSLAYEVDDACRLIQDKNIYVGLAELDGSFSGNGIQPIEELVVRANHVQWLGAISRENVGSTRIKQVISSSFYDYHTLPYEPQRLVSSLGHAYGMAKMYLDDITLSRLDDLEFGEDEMVGASPQLQNVFSTIRKVAIVPAPVLITGESGTGKELTAKAIHERSQFASGPFIAVNCGAIPPSLIQSELFGYEKGSFTGADERKIGYLEAAHGGTIFLDEIGDLPLEQQINLLRFLQEKTIQRVGGTKHIHVEVRVISATHVDLERAVSDRRLREDLYYRLNVLQVKMPSLRNRDGDIELLAKYFFNKFSGEKNKNVKGFSKSCLNPMASYPWQGNVRELINRVRRGMVMCENKLISAHDLGIENSSSTGLQLLSLKHARERAEEEAIRLAVERSSKNMSLAARFLGISRVTLYRLLEKYNICDK
tara:strand:+ start:35 stop:1372 length:1338 start_codon:yes stop_codon:yes gene_type:complete